MIGGCSAGEVIRLYAEGRLSIVGWRFFVRKDP